MMTKDDIADLMLGSFLDLDWEKIQAETARKSLASKTPIEAIIARVDKWNGSGLFPSEVLALREYIHKLEYRITIELGYSIEK